MELNDVYGEQRPSLPTIKRWFNEFKSKRTSIVDMEKYKRPCEINEKITSNLKEIIQNERRITTRKLTERLNVSKFILPTLLSTSGIRKLCSRFVSRLLTADMQARRLQCCCMNLLTLEHVGERMLHNIITMNESPLSAYIHHSKRD